jgi:hypothetical protein
LSFRFAFHDDGEGVGKILHDPITPNASAIFHIPAGAAARARALFASPKIAGLGVFTASNAPADGFSPPEPLGPPRVVFQLEQGSTDSFAIFTTVRLRIPARGAYKTVAAWTNHGVATEFAATTMTLRTQISQSKSESQRACDRSEHDGPNIENAQDRWRNGGDLFGWMRGQPQQRAGGDADQARKGRQIKIKRGVFGLPPEFPDSNGEKTQTRAACDDDRSVSPKSSDKMNDPDDQNNPDHNREARSHTDPLKITDFPHWTEREPGDESTRGDRMSLCANRFENSAGFDLKLL